MKIVVVHGMGVNEEALALMREAAQVTILQDGSEEALLEEARDADVLVASFYPEINRNFIESAVKLKHIAKSGVGVDSVDMKAATEHGIFVTNTPDLTADSVAEFTMALLLSLAKNIPRCNTAVKTGRWDLRISLVRSNIELNAKTHGIVGLGRIGSKVAIRCKAFGMRVLYHKRNRDLDLEKALGIEYQPLDVILRQADSISLHLPLTPETTDLIDTPQFEVMKPAALLINQARGRVVNEAALVRALKEGKIGGYATDVYDPEPPDPKSELLRLENVIATPHLGGANRDSRLRVCMTIAGDVLRTLRGEIPVNLVNKEVLITPATIDSKSSFRRKPESRMS